MTSNYYKPVVVIPVYKETKDWTHSEIKSLKKCCEVLAAHSFFLVGPKNLDLEAIAFYIKNAFGKQVQTAAFENHYFADIPGYNKLLKSLFFYEYFNIHTHILLYQLDAYIFKDELIYWCQKDFDYVGAPWLEGLTNNSSTKLIGVGNGGFSLHNISSAIRVLKRLKLILPILETCERMALLNAVPFFKWVTRLLLLKLAFRISNQRYILKLSMNDDTYEDIFWGKYIPATFSFFKVACVEEATKFSFEVNPRYLYKLNKEKLPFGCHAWEKYDPAFWRQFIKE